MPDRRDKDPELDPDLDAEVREALESDDEARLGLSDEIAKKWNPDSLLRLVSAQAGRGERLDEATRRRYEAKLGVDLGNVRVYRGEFADEMTKAHSAEALTVGGTGMILMGTTAARSMQTRSYDALLAHELTHVAQDTRGVFLSGRQESSSGQSTDHAAAEEEAGQVEQQELHGAGGGRDDGSARKQREELIAKLFARLVEVFEDEERVYELRSGKDRFRP